MRLPGSPADLLDVTKIMAYCKCGHQASIDVSGLPNAVFVLAIKDWLRCGKCGQRPMETSYRQMLVTDGIRRHYYRKRFEHGQYFSVRCPSGGYHRRGNLVRDLVVDAAHVPYPG
jgi:hypothetical protein